MSAAEQTPVEQTPDEMRAEIEFLRSQNAELKKSKPGGVYMKVSEKGGVSVYGLGRFPVTLYKEQWIKLLDMGDNITAFIVEHDSELKTKPAKDE
jgi:hypothetical protein